MQYIDKEKREKARQKFFKNKEQVEELNEDITGNSEYVEKNIYNALHQGLI